MKVSNINPIKVGLGALSIAVIAGMGNASFFTTSEGYLYYVQNKATGGTAVYSEPGIHLKLPLFTDVYTYKRVATIDATANDGDFTRNLQPISVTFADTYTGEVPATFRYRLPTDTEKFRKLHQEFRSFDNLVDALLTPNSRNVAVVTATQYTGEEFVQGGVNAYKAQMEDQLRNGLYITKREQVELTDSGYASVSSENGDADKVEEKTRLVWKNVVQYVTENGAEVPDRLANPIAEYGISLSQVTIGKPIPDNKLDNLLDAKRDSVARKITAQQNIETNRTEAEAAIQEKEIEKQKAIQDAQKAKELAIIAQQQEVEVERQRAIRELVQQQKQKDVAVIQKDKELEIAQANRDIQAANAEAAKYQAIAITEKGLAEAEVDKAKLAAKQFAKDIYMAEIQRDIAQVMYNNLANFNVEMPTNVVMGNEGALPSNLDVLTTFGALGVMDNLSMKTERNEEVR